MLKLSTFLVSLLVVSLTIGSQLDNDRPETSEPINSLPQSAPQDIQNPPIPNKLTFSGEEVPLTDPDIRERLEREILSNTFYHSKTLQVLKHSYRWQETVTDILEDEGVPSDFFYLAVAESALDNGAQSPAGATGMWQFLSSVAKEYDLEINSYVDERRNPYAATKAASAYLKDMKEIFGTWTNSAAAYNRGKNGMRRALEGQKVDSYYDLYLNPETYRYVFRILAYKVIMSAPEKYGFSLTQKDLYPPFEYTVVQIDSTISDLPVFAQEYNTTYKMLKKYNPWLDQNAKYTLQVSPGKSYTLHIPKQ